MEITSINTESLSRMFLAGAKNLDAKKEWINELNVFPVPDGDTGTNMSMTIMSAAREVGALSNPTMKELAKARKMRGVSTLKKGDLIDAMLELDEQEEQKEAAEEAKKVFGDVEIISLGQLPQECAFITDEMTQGAFEEKLAQIGDQVLAKIRVKD